MELITISIRKTNESFHPGKGSRSHRLSLSSSLKSVDSTEKLIIIVVEDWMTRISVAIGNSMTWICENLVQLHALKNEV